MSCWLCLVRHRPVGGASLTRMLYTSRVEVPRSGSHWPPRGSYRGHTSVSTPKGYAALVGPKWLRCLMGVSCESLVASLYTHTSEVWIVCCWVQSFFELLCDQRGKGETSVECKSFMKVVAHGYEQPGSFLIRNWWYCDDEMMMQDYLCYCTLIFGIITWVLLISSN